MRSFQTMEVGFPAGGRAPFLPLYNADIIRLYPVDFKIIFSLLLIADNKYLRLFFSFLFYFKQRFRIKIDFHISLYSLCHIV